MNAVKHWVDLDTAASICYPKGWRSPTNEIDQQRALSDREDRRREDSELDTEI